MEETILVVGAGAMGSGIAFVAARAGYRVELVESDAAARDRGRARIAKDAERAKDAPATARIVWLDAIPAKSEASIAIEAVPERLDLKRTVVRALEAALGPSAVIATNTSSLSVGELADALQRPERMLGLHFFNPPAAMKLVEIVETDCTSDAALDAAHDFVERIGKTAVTAADTPGFIVNRVARPYYLQSLRALGRGVASVLELDALARAAGFRMGPFELMDLIGIDVNLAVSTSVYERTAAERLAPVAMQAELVAQNRLGRKSGTGFYDYSAGDPDRLDCTPAEDDSRLLDEVVVVIGFGGIAQEMGELIERHHGQLQRIENDELIDEIRADATIVIDVGDGTTDRGEMLASLDSLFGPETIVLSDAYATDHVACAARMRHPERLCGYGVLGALESQKAVEIVDSESVSDDALGLAQELFEMLGKGVVLVEDVPGLFLGRTIGSIINEAVIAVQENVATPDDIDEAMRLGTNYPVGPIEWGKEIGGARVSRILHRLAESEGREFAPHRALWVLDTESEPLDDVVEAASHPGILGE